MSHKLLIINPGSTSTNIAVFQDKECVFKTNTNSAAKVLKKMYIHKKT